MTLKDLRWEHFSVYLFSDRKLKSTRNAVYSYRSRFNTLVIEFSEKDFTRQNFTQYLASRETTNKPAYLNNLIKTAHHIDRYLSQTYGTPRQLEGFRFYTIIEEEKPRLSPAEVKNIINVYVDYPYRSVEQKRALRAKYRRILTFLWVTGCRIDEALNLTPRDVMSNHVIFRNTKSNEMRMVPIMPELAEELRENAVGGSVFGWKYEKQLNLELKKRAALCRIHKNVSAHTFRYSFITEMLRHATLQDVGKIVGHKNPATTQKYNQVYLQTLQSVIAVHPYYREQQTVLTLAKQVREYLNGIVDTTRFPIPSEEKISELFANSNENSSVSGN